MTNKQKKRREPRPPLPTPDVPWIGFSSKPACEWAARGLRCDCLTCATEKARRAK